MRLRPCPSHPGAVASPPLPVSLRLSRNRVKCILMPRSSSPMNSLHTQGTWTHTAQHSTAQHSTAQHSTEHSNDNRISNIAAHTTPALPLAPLLDCAHVEESLCLPAAAPPQLKLKLPLAAATAVFARFRCLLQACAACCKCVLPAASVCKPDRLQLPSASSTLPQSASVMLLLPLLLLSQLPAVRPWHSFHCCCCCCCQSFSSQAQLLT
jgi:hypothetical protein